MRILIDILLNNSTVSYSIVYILVIFLYFYCDKLKKAKKKYFHIAVGIAFFLFIKDYMIIPGLIEKGYIKKYTFGKTRNYIDFTAETAYYNSGMAILGDYKEHIGKVEEAMKKYEENNKNQL